MRLRTILAALSVLGAAPCAAAETAGGETGRLEQRWHDCLREAYGRQPPGQSRAASERSALDECREREDALVSALMASRAEADAARGGRSLTARARAWAAAYVVDPVTAWLSAWTR
ncbi:hypothetical protein [Methylobacterium sp. A54F]